MKTDNPFVHDLTPPELAEIGQKIHSILVEEEPNLDELLELTQYRDNFISEYLSKIEVSVKDDFVNNELRINSQLAGLVETMQNEQKELLVKFVRSKKAVQKYK